MNRLPLFTLLSAAVASRVPLPPGDLVNISFAHGTVTGVASASVAYFLAVPFAAPTDGTNSFAPPAPRAPWSGALNGTVWGPGCIQPHHNADVPPLQSFDCLTLNIFAPPSALVPGAAPLPVLVFFNGGAYLEGSDQGPFGMYSGAQLVTNGVVVCTINYRLGAFGWLGGLPASNITGNWGLMDMVAGLQWVRDEIAAVGGDPKQVTVFGESAGAMSIGILLTSPRAAGLFHRALMESNVAGFNYPNASHAALYAASFCSDKALGPAGCVVGGVCSADCLRAATPGAIMSAWNTATGSVPDFILTDLGHIIDGLLGTGPILDGDWVVAEPMSAVESGEYWGKGLPVLLGTNSGEGETFIYDGVDFPLPGFLVPEAYLGLLGFNETAARLVNEQPRYNSSAYADGRAPLSHMVTDFWFRCASERFLAAAAASGAPAYAYRFDHLYSNASIFPTFGLPQICTEVVCHASELPFVFHELPSFSNFTVDEDALAARMGVYWTNFAKGLAPSSDWPAWAPATRISKVLNVSETTESTSELCGFWDSLAGAYFW